MNHNTRAEEEELQEIRKRWKEQSMLYPSSFCDDTVYFHQVREAVAALLLVLSSGMKKDSVHRTGEFLARISFESSNYLAVNGQDGMDRMDADKKVNTQGV